MLIFYVTRFFVGIFIPENQENFNFQPLCYCQVLVIWSHDHSHQCAFICSFDPRIDSFNPTWGSFDIFCFPQGLFWQSGKIENLE